MVKASLDIKLITMWSCDLMEGKHWTGRHFNFKLKHNFFLRNPPADSVDNVGFAPFNKHFIIYLALFLCHIHITLKCSESVNNEITHAFVTKSLAG